MIGHISRLIDNQQFGTIAGEDGIDYVFDSRSLPGMTFGSLHVGAQVTFGPSAETKRAGAVRIADPGAGERSGTPAVAKSPLVRSEDVRLRV